MKTNAGLMAFLGVVFTIAVGAFFIVPQLKERDMVSVTERVSETGAGSGPETGPETAIETGAGDTADALAPSVTDEAPVSQTAETTDEPVDVASLDQPSVRPSFDILRVEPDGSTVIAGKATPNTRLSIMNGETEIASASVGPSGDFAAILDTPLEPGDYQLTLRTSGDEGNVSESEEVAIVSVPESADGELLAMVTTPGKASRIIAQPEAPETDGMQADGGTTTSDASGPAADGSGGESAVETTAATDGSGTAASANAASGNAGTGGEPSKDLATGPASDAAADARIETPELPEMSSLLTTTAPELDSAGAPDASGDVADQTPAGGGEAETAAATEAGSSAGDTATESAASEGSEQDAPATDDGQTEVAVLTPQADSAAAPRLPANATVRVDAVEIEGGRIFIAGSAPAGYPVTVSADGEVIGTEKADASGRFIVEAEVDLSVGDHIISADLIDPDSGSILLRATVPFNRPEGQALAAVAPTPSAADAKTSRVAGEDAVSDSGSATAPESAATDGNVADATVGSGDAGSSAASSAESITGTDEPSADAMVLPDIASLSQMREDAFEALSTLEQMVSNEGKTDAAAVAEARKEAIAKLKAASSADLAADAEANSRKIARSMRMQAQSALAALEPAGMDNNTEDQSTAAQGDMENLREMLREARTALSQPAGELLATTDRNTNFGAETSAEPRTIVQEPLASAPGAVIIRRGDTLWQISRRTYGQGVRYTTIYLANRSQIENPDRIQPGQVFSVPDAPLENAEELHRKRLQED